MNEHSTRCLFIQLRQSKAREPLPLKNLAIGARIRGISLEKGTEHGISSFSIKTRGRYSCTSPSSLGIWSRLDEHCCIPSQGQEGRPHFREQSEREGGCL